MPRLLTASVILLAVFGPAPFASQGNALQGRVILPNGSAPPNSVKVTLTLSGRRVHETFTDLSGRFSFSGLARGIYQLTAEGDDRTFETTTVSAEVVSYGSAPQSFTQNIALRPKSSGTIEPAGVISIEDADPTVPEHALVEYRKGTKVARQDKPDQAIKHFEEAIRAHPPFYLAHVALAEQYSRQRRYEESLAEYRKAVELKPDRADAYAGAGVVLVTQQKYGEAIPHLRRSLQIKADSANALLCLGLAEMMTGDLASAEPHLLRAYDLEKLSVAHIYLANLYESAGEPSKAIDHLESFLKENPDSPHASQIREAVNKLKKRVPRK